MLFVCLHISHMIYLHLVLDLIFLLSYLYNKWGNLWLVSQLWWLKCPLKYYTIIPCPDYLTHAHSMHCIIKMAGVLNVSSMLASRAVKFNSVSDSLFIPMCCYLLQSCIYELRRESAMPLLHITYDILIFIVVIRLVHLRFQFVIHSSA